MNDKAWGTVPKDNQGNDKYMQCVIRNWILIWRKKIHHEGRY